MQLQVGTFRFESPGPEYSRLELAGRRRWTARERHGRIPAREDLGPGARVVVLRGEVVVRGADDLARLAPLRALAGIDGAPGAAPRPQPVFVGGGGQPAAGFSSGRHVGWWTVDELLETHRDLRFGGVPGRIEFQVRLTEADPPP